MRLTRMMFILLVAMATQGLLVSSSFATFVVGGEDGWIFSTDGNVNIFAAYESGDEKPSFGT